MVSTKPLQVYIIYIHTHTHTYDSIEVEEGRKYNEIEGAERFSPSVPTCIVSEELYIGYIYGTRIWCVNISCT